MKDFCWGMPNENTNGKKESDLFHCGPELDNERQWEQHEIRGNT
jgi:hypothetical protein